ncbi:MAG: hypothetical protein AAF434_01650 [Pseudomonadota bacterium]
MNVKSGTDLKLRTYQSNANKTNRVKELDQSVLYLGLTSKAGSIADINRKFLKKSINESSYIELLKHELGSLLWYSAAISTSNDLCLGEIAAENIKFTRDMFAVNSEIDSTQIEILDANYPPKERFPRKIIFKFTEQMVEGQTRAALEIVDAIPNHFPNGPETLKNGKKQGFKIGESAGEPLTNNSRREDLYRYHDAIHIGFMAVLGWSPTMRSLLRLKRKSDSHTDDAEDGARAIFIEEGLSAILAVHSESRMMFEEPVNVDTSIIDIATTFTKDLEVTRIPSWLWRTAISKGFKIMTSLGEHKGGLVTADLDKRDVTFSITSGK